MNRNYVAAMFCALAFVSGSLLVSEKVIGGDGTVVSGSPHKMNLSVAFLYDEQKPDDWKPLFEEASKLLYNATEKQMQFGTITVFNNCPAQQDSADIHVVNDTSGARAHVPGLGIAGRHLWISQTHKSTSGVAIGQIGVVHELGHYAFNLYDEYLGKTLPISVAPTGTPTKDPAEAFYCAMPNGGGKASIMDAGTRVSPANTRTEFCTDPADGFTTSHESGYINGTDYIVNGQQDKHGQSSWDTIVQYSNSTYGITLNAPTSEPQNDVTGHQPITWDVQSCETRAVISIDRSGSMIGQKIVLAKEAGKLFVDLSNNGEDIGVTSFASDASVNFILQEVTSDSIKQGARNAIDGLNASGLTNIGGGLQVSLGQITGVAADQRTDNEIIVLLSDGQHNTGTAPGAVIPSIINEKVKVHTVGLGADADLALLQQIASETGGKFSFAGSAADLAGIFTNISAESRGEALITQEQGQVNSGEEVEKTVFVDSFNKSVTFILSWSTGQLQLTLETPSGQSISSATALNSPDIEFIAGSSYQIYKIQSPETGVWRIQVLGDVIFGVKDFTVSTLDNSNEVEFNVYSDKDQYMFPEQVLIEALVQAGHAVDGASVTGTVKRPDSTSVDFELFDDGMNSHGDERANDGIYSNFFNAYSIDGVYTFSLKVVNEDGFAISPDIFEEDPDSIPQQIPPFTREASTSVIINSIPQFVAANIEFGPETINLKSKGKYVTAYIELPAGYDVEEINLSSVAITAIDGVPIIPILALAKPSEIGNFDNDAANDLMVKFKRQDVQAVLTPGIRVIKVEGVVNREMFVGERGIVVIEPGR